MIDTYEVVKKLIGEIEPIGESQTDERRYENLEAMTGLVNSLMEDIGVVAKFNKDRVEHSMNKAGKHAHGFFAINGINDY